MKLNGGKRIGIIASVVWVLGAGAYTLISKSSEDIERNAYFYRLCEQGILDRHLTPEQTDDAIKRCDRESQEHVPLDITNERLDAALVALIPVPLGWGFAYLVFFLVRWVRRGFVRPL